MFANIRNHTRATRVMHAGLALAVIIQLLSSLVFKAPSPRHEGNFFFEVHEYGGLAAFGFVVLFWLTVVVRSKGTPLGLLFPWFSRSRLADLWADLKKHLTCLSKFRLPGVVRESPLAAAVHGLGLLLILAMATSGTVYYFINNGDPDAGGLVGVVMFVHLTLSNLAWAYLIGHAGLAVVHHMLNEMDLREMWALK